MAEPERKPWPTELRLRQAEKLLVVSYDDGSRFELPAEYLRVESPSAEVQGHGPGQKKLVAGKAKVAINAVEPVGNYAVRLLFDDGHDTGLYSWSYLHELGTAMARNWERYLGELRKAGQSRG